MKIRKSLAPVLIPLLAISPMLIQACADAGPETLETNVNELIRQNEFEEALELLRNAGDNASNGLSSVDINELKIYTHLAYANYLTHEADHLGMRNRMSYALRHYRRVLELDEDNREARTHIDLIEGIYQQMGREIPEGVAD